MPVAFRSGLRRRSPWPYSIKLSGTGLMCGTKDRQSADLVSAKPQDQAQVQPTKFGASGDNPVLGTVTGYGSPLGFPYGMGQRMQRKPEDDGAYYYALGVDWSSGIGLKGPDITTFTPGTTDATNGVTGFIEVAGTMYPIAGRYALQYVSDASFTVARDFGSGKAAVDATAFYSNGAGAAYGFVAMGDSENFWYVAGGAWAQHASLTALSFARVGREFWRGYGTSNIAKVDVDADPTVAVNWGAPFSIGDKSSAITRLGTTAGDALVCLKTDGVYSLDETGTDHNEYPFLRAVPDATNGKALASWGNNLYTTYVHSGTFSIDPDFESEPVGPELLLDNDSVVKGYPTAMEGSAYGLYALWYNPDTGDSYLCIYKGMTLRDGKRVPVWHGSLSAAFTGKRGTAMHRSTIGAPSGHARMYMGFSDGSFAWFTLPCTANPAACSSYRFTTANTEINWPTWHACYPGLQKAIETETVQALNLSSTNYCQVQYRTDPAGLYTTMGTSFASGQRQTVEFASGAAAILLDQKLVFVNSANTASPQVTGTELRFILRTPFKQVHSILVLAEDGLVKHDGTPMKIGAVKIASVLETAADTAGSITLVLPDESNKEVVLGPITHTQAWDKTAKKMRAAYELQFSEVVTNRVYGTHGRMMAYSHAELENYSHSQLMAI